MVKHRNRNYLISGIVIVIIISGFVYSSPDFRTFTEEKFSLTSLSLLKSKSNITPTDISCTFKTILVSRTSEGKETEISQVTKSLLALDLIDPETNEPINNLKIRFQDKCDVDKNTRINLEYQSIGLVVYVDNKQCFFFNWCYTFIERIILYDDPGNKEFLNKRIMDKFTPIKDSVSFDLREFDEILSSRSFTQNPEIVFLPFGYIKYDVDGQEAYYNISPEASKVSWVISIT